MTNFPPGSPAESVLVTHNVAAMRARPDESAEMVSQAVSGAVARVLDADGAFLRLETADAYTGWTLRQHTRVCAPDDPFLAAVPDSPHCWRVSAPLAALRPTPSLLRPPLTQLVFGTPLLGLDEIVPDERRGANPAFSRVQTAGNTIGFVLTAQLRPETRGPLRFTPARLTALAARFLGVPYLWGGITPFGFDCSGLVQCVHAAFGIQLPRDAYQQAVSPLGAILPADAPIQRGDLLFYGGPRAPRQRGITHVGLAYDNDRLLHAWGRAGVTLTRRDDPDFAPAYAYRGGWRFRAS